MITQLHLGKLGKKPLKGHGKSLWHSDDNGLTYWSGDWYDRTPQQIKTEAESVLRDLRKMHPEMFPANSELSQSSRE